MSTPTTIDITAIFNQLMPLISLVLSVFVVILFVKMFGGFFKELV
jgi:hypothetical protein